MGSVKILHLTLKFTVPLLILQYSTFLLIYNSGAEHNFEWSGQQLTIPPSKGHTLKGWEFIPTKCI